MINAPLFGAGKHAKIFRKLALEAVNVKPVGRARIVSAIVYRGDLLAIGHNQMKTHPFQARYGKNKDSIYLHAEISTIHKALKELDLEDLEMCTLYVCRVKYYSSANKIDFVSGLACPCAGCQRAIATFGIKKVYFSQEGGAYASL